MDPDMMDECRYCASGRVVPVLDVRIEESPTAGNKFRSRCLECDRWLPMTSAETFENHLHPHVLPQDADPEEPGSCIPLEEWDRRERFEDVLERLEDYQDRDRPYSVVDADAGQQQAVADGGQVVEEEPADEDVQEDGDDEIEAEEINRFECPATGCEHVNEGYPDECPACGAAYDWS